MTIPSARRWTAAAACLLLLAAASRPCVAQGRPLFAADPVWDDGKAEVDLYRAEETLYGEKRSFEARMIVVKEDMREDLKVKSETGPIPGKTREVLKLNHLRRVPAGAYEDYEMLSVLLDRASLRVLKLTMSHFESCGATFLQILPQPGSLLHVSHSYWDGEGDRTIKIPFSEEDLLADALPLQLRALDFRRAARRDVKMLPSQISGRVQALAPIPATLAVSGPERVEVPAGRFQAYRVEIARTGAKDRYYFEVDFPHRLLEMETGAGSVYRLRKSLRLDYWNHHRNGEEKLLE